ncbi:MAG: PAS domain-containing protein [Nannocystaceae bacterium]
MTSETDKRTIAGLEQRIRELEAQQTALLEASQGMAWVKDCDGNFIRVNRQIAQAAGTTPEAMVGKSDLDYWPKEQAEAFRADDRTVMQSGHVKQVEEPIDEQLDNQTVWLSTRKAATLGPEGENWGTAGTARDISEERWTAIDRKRVHDTLVATRDDLIDELTTPILKLWRGILVVPLIGTIDSHRIQRLLDTLLVAIHNEDARDVLLDVTGVRRVNGEVARLLLRTVQAARLSGARCALVGIRPDVARALVDAEVDMGNLPTYGSLEQALAVAIKLNQA